MLGEMLNPYYLQIVSFVLINVLLALSIYLTLSTGQLSLGQAGFMAIGAYVSTILTDSYGLPMVAGMFFGSLAACVAGILVGLPTLRLKGVYLAIATLGFGEVLRVLLINQEGMTNGAVGISGIPHMGREAVKGLEQIGLKPKMLQLNASQGSSLLIVLLLLGVAIFLIVTIRMQQQSRIGRAFAAIRMDEQAAAAMGVHISYYKVLAFSQGALVAGLAGALYAHMTGYISPSDFSYHRAVEILIFAVFGGSEVILGPIFGAFFLTLLPEFLRELSEYRYMIYGAILVLMMAIRPQGLIDANLLRIVSQLLRKLAFRKSKAMERDGEGVGD